MYTRFSAILGTSQVPAGCYFGGTGGVAAELVAQGGHHLHGRGAVLAGLEPGKQGGGDGRCGNGVGNGFFHSPPALARVLDVVVDVLQSRVLVQRLDQEVQQPGPDHGAFLPGPEGAGQVIDDVLGRQKLVALGICLHQAVLDAVVDHLGVVACADTTHVDKAVSPFAFGPQGIENRKRAFDVCRVPAGHQAITVLQPPHTAGHTTVREVDALGGKEFAVFLVLSEAGVPAVDHQVTLVQLFAEFLDDGVGDVAGRHHHPDEPRGGDSCDELIDGAGVRDVRVPVVAGNLHATLAQAFAHVESHFAKADQSNVHGGISFCAGYLEGGGGGGWEPMGISWGGGPASRGSGSHPGLRRPRLPGP